MADRVLLIVFDCSIFASALITPSGAGGKCVQRVLEAKASLFWSEYVLAEIRRIPEKKTPRRLGVTIEKVEALIARLKPLTSILNPAPMYQHPIDPKDSHYVDLALSAGANGIVTRDAHLLNLVDPSKADSADFAARFPKLRILTPEQFLVLVSA